MSEATRERYRREGYVVQVGLIGPEVAADLTHQIEAGIDAMAADLAVSREAYLGAVCRWSTPNPMVEALVASVTEALRPVVTDVLGVAVWPSRASVFRKSAEASLGTHAHQDAGYWVRVESSRYCASTWVALGDVDEASGALRVIPGSHHGEVAPPVDYLAVDFVDPATAWSDEARSLPVPAGSAVTFNPRLWHASHSSRLGRIRHGLAIRWKADGAPVSESGVARVHPPPRQAFGIYTSGAYLRAALRQLAGGEVPAGVAGVRMVLDRAATAELPDPEGARAALERLVVFLRASEAHRATDQRAMVWEPVRDLVVAPTVGLG